MNVSVIKKSALAGLLWATAGIGQAALVTQTLPDYTSALDVWSEYVVPLNVGSFNTSNLKDITSATISGTFGNAFSNTSTEAYVYAEGVELAYCSVFDDCYSQSEGTAPVAWSYTFTASELALFSDGFLNISISKEFEGYVNLGSLTLQLQATQVPEPASAALVLAGLAGLGLSLRRRRQPS